MQNLPHMPLMKLHCFDQFKTRSIFSSFLVISTRTQQRRVLWTILFKDTLKTLDDFKSNESVWDNVLDMQKYIYIFWKFIQCTIQNADVKNISFGLNKRSKICTIFLSRAPTHHSFTFNSRFLYELKHKVFLSKSVCGILHFRFRLVFIKVYFCSRKSMDSLTLKRHNSFQN